MDERAEGMPPNDAAQAAEQPEPEEEAGATVGAGPDPAAVRETIERLVATGIGAVGATADRAESLLGASGSGQRIGERASSAIAGLLDDLGLVKRERLDELELKVAQLEHRIRLLEEGTAPAPTAPPGPAEA